MRKDVSTSCQQSFPHCEKNIWLIKGLGTKDLNSSNMADLKGSALVILAEGAEEMEAVITADVLRRGKVR